MAANNAVELCVDDITQCPICKDDFTDPRSLPCLHTFCLKCLKGHCRWRDPGEGVKCPLCRKEFIIPDDGVDCIQKNFYFESLVTARKETIATKGNQDTVDKFDLTGDTKSSANHETQQPTKTEKKSTRVWLHKFLKPKEHAMEANFRSVLKKNYDILSRCLVVSPGLLFKLKSVDYMQHKVPQIRQQATADMKVAELLNILDEVPDSQEQSVYTALLSALRQDGQEHVANIFRPKSEAHPMSNRHNEQLLSNKEELVQFINPTYPLLARLQRNGVLTQSDEEIIRSRSNYSEMSLELVNILVRKQDSAFDKFIDTLKETDQQHVVYILTGKGKERPLSRVRRKVLITARKDLVRKVEIIQSTLVAELVSNGVLNEVDMLHIEAKETSEDKTSVLIDAIARKSQSAYDKFLQALKHKDINQLSIARTLEGLELRGIVETNFRNDVEDADRSKIIQIVRDEMKALINSNDRDVYELTLLMEQNGFAVSEITEGSIHISFRYFTEESLVNLKRLYTDKTLDKLFTQVFCPQFAQQGLESLTLNITDDEFQKATETFRQMETDSKQDATSRMLIQGSATDQLTTPQTSLRFTSLPVELLELVLMRIFIKLFTVDYKSHYKTHNAIRLAGSTLAGVCYNWWQTMNGWSQSTTKHWFKHKLRRAVKYVCRPYTAYPRLLHSLPMSGDVRGVTQCDSKLFVICWLSNTITVFGPNSEQHTRIELEELNNPTDIVSCTETKQLYVAAWSRDSTRCVWRVSLDGLKVVKWLPNKSTTTSKFRPHSLSVGLKSRRLLVTSLACSELLLYGSDGIQLKHLPLPVEGLRHAVETSHGTFIICHYTKAQSRVCEVNTYGQVIYVYSDQQLSKPIYLSLDSDGRVFITDYSKQHILLLNSHLELERVLLDTQQHQLSCPWRLCYMEPTGQLAIAGRERDDTSGVQLFIVR